MLNKEDIKIIFKFDNPYFNRTEYKLLLKEEVTTERKKLREILSKIFNVKSEQIVIRKIITKYGGIEKYAYVNVYNEPSMIKIESEHILLKHLSKEERKKILEEKKKKKLELKEKVKKR